MKFFIWPLAISLVIAANVYIKYNELEKVAENSRFEKWPDDFKMGFVKECSLGLLENLHISKKSHYKLLAIYGSSYCNCIADEVESAQVMRTTFNPLRSEEQFLEEADKSISDFMTSESGIAAMEGCTNKAKVISNYESYEEEIYRDIMVSNCVIGTVEGIQPEDARYELVKDIGGEYCNCLIGHMFENKIIDIFQEEKNFNRKIASFDNEISDRIETFMRSKDGEKQSFSCHSQARNIVKLRNN